MSEEAVKSTGDWMNAFVSLGAKIDERWEPAGAGVLVVDLPVLWLVTASANLDRLEGQRIGVWAGQADRPVFMDLTHGLATSGLDWIRHPERGIAATLFPVDPELPIKAFSELQCSPMKDLHPLLPTVSLGCIYGAELRSPGYPSPAVFEGIVSRVDAEPGVIYSTAPLLPRNAGAPLLLASPYGGSISLAGVLVSSALIPEVDPRTPPTRLSVAVPCDEVMALLRSEEARQQRKRAANPATSATEGGPR